MRAAWASSAYLAVAPVQDVVEAGSEARMNLPGSCGGNWAWRLPPHTLTPDRRERLAALNRETARTRPLPSSP